MPNSLTVFCEECGKQWKVCDLPVDVKEVVNLASNARCDCKADRMSLYIGELNTPVEEKKE